MTTPTKIDTETAAGFLTERADYLFVHVVPTPSGSGWDVVLRVDGSYSDRRTAEGAAQGIKDWLSSLQDVPNEGRDWWAGPPWLRGPGR